MLAAIILEHSGKLTFGRTTAQFKQLIAAMALVSIVIWTVVLITMIIRIATYHLWYRRRYSASRINSPQV